MFTGIVESIGKVLEVAPSPNGVRARFGTTLAEELAPGDSVAVNGVCLTVVARGENEVVADIGQETARITNLSGLAAGAPVNLERAMRVDGRLGGHLMQGHVDALGRIVGLREEGGTIWLTVGFPPAVAPYLIHKGSVAVDGVSLTVAALRDGEFDVQIIPFTWQHTNLSARQIGDRVNLECDMIGKYVARTMELRGR